MTVAADNDPVGAYLSRPPGIVGYDLIAVAIEAETPGPGMSSPKAGFPNLSNEDDICQANSAHLNDGQLTAVSTLSPVSPQGS